MGSFPGCPRRADRTQQADLDSSGWPRASMGARRSRTNADDRLPLDPLGLDPLGHRRGSRRCRGSSIVVRHAPAGRSHAVGHARTRQRSRPPGRRRAAPRPARRWTPVFLRLESGLRTASRCRRRGHRKPDRPRRWADLVSWAVLLGYAPRGAGLTLTTQSRSDKPHRVPPVRQVQLDDRCGPQCRRRRHGWSCATAATFMSY
jgi:hypothetical protein